MSVPFFPISIPALDSLGKFVDIWRRFFEGINGSISTLTTQINAVPGVNYFTLATQPTLGPTNVGYVGYEKDTGHYVYFDGAAWQLLGSGDAPGRFEHFAVAPVSGWQRCDGTATTYLVVGGATLTTTAFTTPNLSGTPGYLKDGAYTGAINAKSGSTATGTTGAGTTGTGTTGTGTTGTGTSGNESSHTHGVSQLALSPVVAVPSGQQIGTTGGNTGLELTNLAGVTTDAGSAHSHSVPGLSVPGLSIPSLTVAGLSVPALGVGSIEMANLAAPMYFRR